MAHGHKSEKGSTSAHGPVMKTDMESPLFAQKGGAEEGPQAPTGLPDWKRKDPLGICPGDNE